MFTKPKDKGPVWTSIRFVVCILVSSSTCLGGRYRCPLPCCPLAVSQHEYDATTFSFHQRAEKTGKVAVHPRRLQECPKFFSSSCSRPRSDGFGVENRYLTVRTHSVRFVSVARVAPPKSADRFPHHLRDTNPNPNRMMNLSKERVRMSDNGRT